VSAFESVQQALSLFFDRYATNPEISELPVLVAYSGGLDSTVLLHALHARQMNVQAVHVNHHLQAEAELWPAHCAAFCANLGVFFECLDVHVREEGMGLEAQARTARYRAIYPYMLRYGIQALFCGHHQDDQHETVLLQMLRGSGLRGLAGMRDFGLVGVDRHLHPTLRVCRPLLTCTKNDLEAYAKHHQLPFVQDPSNTDTQLRRNWIRHELLPQLRDYFPHTDHGLQRLTEHFQEYFTHVDQALSEAHPALLDQHNRLSIQAWRVMETPQQLEVLRAWLQGQGVRCGKNKLLELHRQLLTAKQGGVRQVSQGWRVYVAQGWANLQGD
jgi:tRNA(Ile)-lysidine synthase